jgi:hypothetical protein
MVATTATDTSGVEYYFTCTIGDGNDSDWQPGTTYEDTDLTPATEYTYTVKARDKSAAQNQTDTSTAASATTDAETIIIENIVLPANGGNLDSFTSEYDSSWGYYPALNLINGNTTEIGWISDENGNPGSLQEFVFSFRDGKNASLSNPTSRAMIYGGDAESGVYHCKDVEVHVSYNGTTFTSAGSGKLESSNSWIENIDLTGISSDVKKIKLVITSGYASDYWELAEFEVYGDIID